MSTEQHRAGWRTWIAPAVTVFLLACTFGLLLTAHAWKRSLAVASIDVVGTHILRDSDIVRLAGVARGEKLFSVDLVAVKHRVEQNPFVRFASVQRDAPDKITVVVEEREPLAAAVTDRMVYLDADGYVMPAVRSDFLFDVPVITGGFSPADCVPGKRISADGVQQALMLLKTAKEIGDETYRQISEVHADTQHDLMLYTAEYGIPVIVGRGNEAEKLLALDGFWKEIVARRGAQGLQYIDLRFEDQVVVRWGKDHAALMQ